MNTTTHSQRYLPHNLDTKFYAVKLYRTGVGIAFVCRRYHISKSYIMRWSKKFDDTIESLLNKSHHPLSRHPNAHTDMDLKWIRDSFRRNPNISICELYGKLRTAKGYSRHPASRYRICRRLGYLKHVPYTKVKCKPQKYDTPAERGEKWQMDVKHVPAACYSGSVQKNIISIPLLTKHRGNALSAPYMEQSSYSSIYFLRRAIACFGYKPKILQADNGTEFAHTKKTNMTHPLDAICGKLGITHKRIRPRTPWHNGNVERSHRNDQERFYNHLSFYSYDNLIIQMKRYRIRSNNIPMQTLGWQSPIERQRQFQMP